MSLVDKLLAVHRQLAAASIPHAFGGALALAWCTQRARGTIDLDINVFTDPARAESVLEALPSEVSWSELDRATVVVEGQVRLWWGETPLDLFFNVSEFHTAVADRVRWEPLAGVELPFLACSDLAVFKAFFDRTRDWADLEEMITAGSLNGEAALGTLVAYLGPDDARVARLQRLL